MAKPKDRLPKNGQRRNETQMHWIRPVGCNYETCPRDPMLGTVDVREPISAMAQRRPPRKD